MSNRITRPIAIMTLTVLAAGCGVARARTIGETEAERFRQRFENEKYDDIYEDASPQFRQVIGRQAWISGCIDVGQRLGRWRTSTLKDTQVILVDSGGYIVNVIYATEFAAGPATELLSFFVNDASATLLAYHIDSPALQQSAALRRGY